MGLSADLDRLDTALRAIKQRHGVKGEVKWQKLSASNLACYCDLVDELMLHLEGGRLKYRQMFLDRTYVWQPPAGEPPPKELDTQFKLYYQFLKHSFGLRHLPISDGRTKILIRLDEHSSQAHKARLVAFCEGLPVTIARPDLDVCVTFINSAKSPRLQICDILMGAAGSHGNRMAEKREAGQVGMKPKQRVRASLCQHIYSRLRDLDRRERGSRAFNWFETTGRNGDNANWFHHALRIWKFKPGTYRIDRGWQNDHLDGRGNYVGPDLA